MISFKQHILTEAKTQKILKALVYFSPGKFDVEKLAKKILDGRKDFIEKHDLKNQSKFSCLRGYVLENEEIIFWNAYDGWHFDIAEQLRVPYTKDNSFYVSYVWKTEKFVIQTYTKDRHKLLKKRYGNFPAKEYGGLL